MNTHSRGLKRTSYRRRDKDITRERERERERRERERERERGMLDTATLWLSFCEA